MPTCICNASFGKPLDYFNHFKYFHLLDVLTEIQDFNFTKHATNSYY
jgi:hypothetical protein